MEEKEGGREEIKIEGYEGRRKGRGEIRRRRKRRRKGGVRG